MFPMPDILPFAKALPLAVLKKPEILPLEIPPPLAELSKPETPVPVLLKPELVRPVLVVEPKPVFTLPEFQKPVFVLPEFPKPVLVAPESLAAQDERGTHLGSASHPLKTSLGLNSQQVVDDITANLDAEEVVNAAHSTYCPGHVCDATALCT